MKRTRRPYNNVKELVREFANSSIDCVCVDDAGYSRTDGLCYSLNAGIKRCDLQNEIEAHQKDRKVYMVKSNKIDRSTLKYRKKENK